MPVKPNLDVETGLTPYTPEAARDRLLDVAEGLDQAHDYAEKLNRKRWDGKMGEIRDEIAQARRSVRHVLGYEDE